MGGGEGGGGKKNHLNACSSFIPKSHLKYYFKFRQSINPPKGLNTKKNPNLLPSSRSIYSKLGVLKIQLYLSKCGSAVAQWYSA